MSKITNCWNFDSSAFEKTNANSSSKDSHPYDVFEGGPEDYLKIRNLYEQSPIPGYSLAKVEVIFNRDLEQLFEAKTHLLEYRSENKAFDSKWLEDQDKNQKSLREKTSSILTEEVKRRGTLQRHVQFLPMFYGTHAEFLESIFQTGYDDLRTFSTGVLGKGLYHSSDAELAYRVHGTGTLLFNWIAFYSAYPVIPEDIEHLKGKTRFQNYDVHFALMSQKTEKNGHVHTPFKLGKKLSFDTLVAFDSAQVLPRYVVTLEKSDIKNLAERPTKDALLTSIEFILTKVPTKLQRILSKLKDAMSQADSKQELSKKEEWLYWQAIAIGSALNEESFKLANLLTEQLFQKLSIFELQDAISSPGSSEKSATSLQKAVLVLESDHTALYRQAIDFIKSSAEKGDAEAQYHLGHYYHEGKGVGKNDGEAFKFWKLAADQKHSLAEYEVGLCYKLGRGVAQDYKLGMPYFERAADQGHAESQDYMGHCYYNGYSVVQDDTKAVKYFTLSAQKGNASALEYLGICHLEGRGVVKNGQKAFKYFKSIEKENRPVALFHLGDCYLNGRGTDPDLEKAIDCFRKGALQGNARAQFSLGLCYDKGEGVKQDLEEAVKYYRLAADQQHVEAQNNLGVCYQNGQGVAKDFAEAFNCFKSSTHQGNFEARNNLALCYRDGLGIKKDLEEAFKHFELAANGGNSHAMHNLGLCYLNGQGCKKDLEKAQKYLALAVKEGNIHATDDLNLIKAKEEKVKKAQTKK